MDKNKSKLPNKQNKTKLPKKQNNKTKLPKKNKNSKLPQTQNNNQENRIVDIGWHRVEVRSLFLNPKNYYLQLVDIIILNGTEYELQAKNKWELTPNTNYLWKVDSRLPELLEHIGLAKDISLLICSYHTLTSVCFCSSKQNHWDFSVELYSKTLRDHIAAEIVDKFSALVSCFEFDLKTGYLSDCVMTSVSWTTKPKIDTFRSEFQWTESPHSVVDLNHSKGVPEGIFPIKITLCFKGKDEKQYNILITNWNQKEDKTRFSKLYPIVLKVQDGTWNFNSIKMGHNTDFFTIGCLWRSESYTLWRPYCIND